MLGPAYFLAGDSFIAKSYIEEALRPRLAPAFSDWIGTREIAIRCGTSGTPTELSKRLALLKQIAPEREAGRRAVLIGRSSGGRVASLFALHNPVAAVVCLGYPFRFPTFVLEPERFAHLAHIAVPTLILQGTRDEYGGADITEHYALSPAVTVKLVDTDHDFRLLPSVWDDVAQTILGFSRHVHGDLPFEGSRFDEAFYRATYPDVAKAVEAGTFDSGQHHFHQFGRREHRRFRLLADD